MRVSRGVFGREDGRRTTRSQDEGGAFLVMFVQRLQPVILTDSILPGNVPVMTASSKMTMALSFLWLSIVASQLIPPFLPPLGSIK